MEKIKTSITFRGNDHPLEYTQESDPIDASINFEVFMDYKLYNTQVGNFSFKSTKSSGIFLISDGLFSSTEINLIRQDLARAILQVINSEQ